MCELLALSARLPTTIRLSLDELSQHGGATGPHRDGWGVSFMLDGDAQVFREAGAASESRLMRFLKGEEIRSATVIAHIRKATQGHRHLRNTQPFIRELGGRTHAFAHNGMLPGIEADARFPTRRFLRVGDTDSEHAFCSLLEDLAPLWVSGEPPLEERMAVVARFAARLRMLGSANFLYTDGNTIFAHGHRRQDESGVFRPPGLHVLCRRCAAHDDGPPLAGIVLEPDHEQEVALVASVPLTSEPWEALREGELVVLHEGRVARRVILT
jgi:glutamine amidotransferase